MTTEYRITRLGHHGDGITEGPLFAPLTLPGEVVTGTPEGDRLADLRIVTPSADRVAPPCRHFKSCGGCQLQHASDPFVATWKQDVVARALAANGLEAPFRPIHTSPPQSRRRATLSARRTKKGALAGFHARASDTIIEIPGYTHHDKIEIAKQFLIPKLLERHGLERKHMSIEKAALEDVINYHTREAGVRLLEQRLADLCRSAAVKVASAREANKKDPRIRMTPRMVERVLGNKRFEYEIAQRVATAGVATGMAWTPTGGDILFIEATAMPGRGDLVITGKLGEVMQESVRAAMSLIRSHYEDYGLSAGFNREMDIHLHVPAGAVPKDGPSAGVTIFSALLSLFKQECIRAEVAMTGEITLRGSVLPVGGIKEKVMGAHRAGIRHILMPERNKRDLSDVKDDVKKDMKFTFIKTIDDLLPEIFTKTSNQNKSA